MDTPGDSTKKSKPFTLIILFMALALNARETAAMQAGQAAEQTRQILAEDRQDRQDSEDNNDDNAVTTGVNDADGAVTRIANDLPLELPRNLRVPPNMRPTLMRMLQRSATFRRQIATLTRKPAVRVSVVYGGMRGDRHYHALSTVRKHEWGAMIVDTTIYVPADLVEIIVHELEHVCEQMEGVDLPALARRRGVGVYNINGHYETARAIRAGQNATREYHDGPDSLQQAVRATY